MENTQQMIEQALIQAQQKKAWVLVSGVPADGSYYTSKKLLQGKGAVQELDVQVYEDKIGQPAIPALAGRSSFEVQVDSSRTLVALPGQKRRIRALVDDPNKSAVLINLEAYRSDTNTRAVIELWIDAMNKMAAAGRPAVVVTKSDVLKDYDLGSVVAVNLQQVQLQMKNRPLRTSIQSAQEAGIQSQPPKAGV